MRTLLIALMIALLPVRGWVGEVMAFGMLEPSTATGGVSHLAGCQEHEASAPMALAGAHGGASKATDTVGGAHPHSTCDICNGPLMAAPATDLSAHASPQPWFAESAERFASSEPRRDIKPPIA